jgi:membrane protein YqaA with SNARE-associated domain
LTGSGEDGGTGGQAHAPARKRAGPLRRLYEWTIHWAQTRHAPWALFLLAFAEASFFPIPPDVLLTAMALGSPKKSLRYSAICTAGSVLGGCFGYAIGALLFDAVGRPILQLYGYLPQFEKISLQFAQHDFLFIFIAALTPIPYKVFTIAAGVCSRDVSLQVLILASIAGRGLRFFGLGALFTFFGVHIKLFIDKYFDLLTVALLAVGVLGFLAVKLLVGTGERQVPPAPRPQAAPAPVGQAAPPPAQPGP